MQIAISGAGVAGPTLAYWLRRTGHEPTLIERAPQFRTGGYLIDFWGVGYRIAQRMGLEAAIQNAGYQLQSLHSMGSDGQIHASLKVDGFRRAARGELVSVARGDLAATIYAAVEHDVETIFDDSITAINQHPDCVSVSFARADTRQFDLVIGADGLHSNVRRLAFGPAADTERYLGCLVAAAVVEGYRPRDELVYVTYSAPARSVGRFSLRDDRTLFLFVFRSADGRDPGDLEARKALLWSEFGDAGWECKQILAALDDADELYFDVVSQVRMDRWSQDRVALVGDAAACVSLLAGEGTGLAMTEAYVLAGELQRAHGDYRKAFSAYESRMRGFVERKQAGALKMLPVFATKTEFGIWFRDLVMRAMSVGPLFDLIVTRTLRDDIDLPDYPM
ncbi:FAD-binding domain [Mycobacterium sp. CVI_P3]|uniref:FAD-binding domain n=1 Tax=Mycobacterium pinniadriaticum TaxID=2994102 RepID=A0ABT3S9I8_9MYCO|nr:FAD-binding domain [Mycobacterium pinniadriaticum]MCX2929725.1 FAD-binding domain [Mycobacterium pinniadriaticum]MCX2936149.1 FAD-binding domain [Mycobacterium pinniadriaticum]